MNVYEMYQTDLEKETKGVPHDLGAAGKIWLARASAVNTRYARALMKETDAYRTQIEHGTMDPAVMREIMIRVFADEIVRGWDGITDRNGNPIPFSRENCVKLFTDLPDLFVEVQEKAAKMSNFLVGKVEEDAKNS